MPVGGGAAGMEAASETIEVTAPADVVGVAEGARAVVGVLEPPLGPGQQARGQPLPLRQLSSRLALDYYASPLSFASVSRSNMSIDILYGISECL